MRLWIKLLNSNLWVNKFILIILFMQTLPSQLVYSIEIDSRLVNIVHNRKILENSIEIVSLDTDNYLISIAYSDVDGSLPVDKLRALREAKLIAEENMISFVYGVQITSIEELKNEIITTKYYKNGELVAFSKEYSTSLFELIKERTEGGIKNILHIDKWYNKKFRRYYYAVALKFLQE